MADDAVVRLGEQVTLNGVEMKCYGTCLGLIMLFSASFANAQNTFPTSGNVGIGTTPNAWGAPYLGNVLQVGSSGFEGAPNYNILSLNTYYDGTNWRYIGSAPAQLTFSVNGDWYWQSAGSGTAGSIAALSTPMALVGGSLGIGTSSPTATLEVGGKTKFDGQVTYPDGSVQSVAWNGILSGGDYAESVDVAGKRTVYEPGDVLVIDREHEGCFKRASEPYSTAVTGIYSTRPGALGRRQKTDATHIKDEVPMAMTGIVPTKVTTANGPVKPGDLLVTSSEPGFAMKATDHSRIPGAVVGKALGHLDSGTGVIEVVVTLQ